MGDRDKECKKLTSRAMKGLMFSGVDTDRKDFIKFVRRLNDIFELSYEEEFTKSGGWNYGNLSMPTKDGVWKVPPFETKPASDAVTFKLYKRIEAMSACCRITITTFLTLEQT